MNFIQEMGIKELEHVVLKAKTSLVIGDHIFEPGEPILYFRNIQIAMLSEDNRVISARGGYKNPPLVIWEDRHDLTFAFSNGTINQNSLGLLLGVNALKTNQIYIPHQEIVEVENGIAYLSYLPAANKPQFFKSFEAENIQRAIHPIHQDKKMLQFNKDENIKTIMADYYFLPKSGGLIYTMAQEKRSNLYTLEATFYLKDENEGLLHTGVLEMPKVYIQSNINLRMGERADPTVGTFRIVAMPDRLDDNPDVICRITYLDEDIYGI